MLYVWGGGGECANNVDAGPNWLRYLSILCRVIHRLVNAELASRLMWKEAMMAKLKG
jgi:hypothetical protein